MMKFIDVQGIFLSFWDVIDLIANRNTVLFGIGSALLIAFLLCWKFLPISIKTGKRSKWIYRFMPFVGAALIIVSMWMGKSFKWGIWFTDSDNPEVYPENSSNDASIIEEIIDADNRIRIRVNGKKVIIGNVECDNKDTLNDLLKQNYNENVKIRIIDDFAEYQTDIWVKNVVDNIAPNYEEEMQ